MKDYVFDGLVSREILDGKDFIIHIVGAIAIYLMIKKALRMASLSFGGAASNLGRCLLFCHKSTNSLGRRRHHSLAY